MGGVLPEQSEQDGRDVARLYLQSFCASQAALSSYAALGSRGGDGSLSPHRSMRGDHNVRK